MTREEILDSIRAVAKRTGTVPGRQTFEKETGIARHLWYGRYWPNWGSALSDAGFQPNDKNGPSDRHLLLSTYLKLVEELGHVPTEGELRVWQRSHEGFPSHSTFRSVLGPKDRLLKALLEYSRSVGAPEHVQALVAVAIGSTPEEAAEAAPVSTMGEGFVYLMKSGKNFKIGRTNAVDRRQYEIGIQLPEPLEPVHSIRTDDPSGIEAYWHNRFRDRRLNGEWFRLDADDVRAFKKRRFM